MVPVLEQTSSFSRIHGWLKGVFYHPDLGNRLQRLKEADMQTSKKSSTECRGFCDNWSIHPNVEDIGQESA